MTRLVLPSMKEKNFGRIINIASVHGLVASANKSAYVAAKHGVLGLTKVTALETAGEANLTCNAVCPAWVLTPLVEAQVQARATAEGIWVLVKGLNLSYHHKETLLFAIDPPYYLLWTPIMVT